MVALGAAANQGELASRAVDDNEGDQELPPYVMTGEPVAVVSRRAGVGYSPMEHIMNFFNTWSCKAEELAPNIYLNRMQLCKKLRSGATGLGDRVGCAAVQGLRIEPLGPLILTHWP